MARLDTHWHNNPKVLQLGLAAMGLHAWSISYCDSALTDGFIPAGALPNLPGVLRAVKALVASQRWDEVDGGFRLHDYLVYNRSKEHVASVQAAKQAAGRAGGLARARRNGKQNP